MRVNQVFKILDQPTVYASCGSRLWGQLPDHDRPAFLLAHPPWYLGSAIPHYFHWRSALKKKNITLILANNSVREHLIARLLGFKSYLLNQNIHTNEHIFDIAPESERQFDAVYVAAASRYKRMHLAQDVKRLYIVTYFENVPPGKAWQLADIEPRISHAQHNSRFLGQQEIRTVMNRSVCGLALSRREGAMFACTEYLLCGLPIVSTRSVGGRDFFFEDDYARLVDANPRAVREAVYGWSQGSLSAQEIRTRVLRKIEAHRHQYYEMVAALAGRFGESPDDFASFSKRLWGPPDGIQRLRVLPPLDSVPRAVPC